MVFNSFAFLIFIAIVLVSYYQLRHNAQNWLLLAASYVFYGWWDVRFLALLLFSSLFDYGCGLWIAAEPSPRKRRLFLAFSMTVNLGFLGIFKYYDFFAGSFQVVLRTLGMNADLPTLHMVLPVGISFYTFMSMSYTIDVYRGQIRATRNLRDFLLFVAFFPHLVAGPILRASMLLPQCVNPRRIDPGEIENGLWLILLGYVKKVVIADRLAQIANWSFGNPIPPFHDATAWLGIYAFAFQIYGDFSGYSDIARGLAKLLGFELVVNFRAPYLVTNPSRFWQHWHISLSTWLRDYLYIPLGGNRGSRAQTGRNLMVTMLLGGLWHGAGAAYVLWGFYHGLLLAVHRWWSEQFPAKPDGRPHAIFPRVRHALLVFFFFHLVCLGWLIFRAGPLPPSAQIPMLRAYLASLTKLHFTMHPILRSVLLLGALSLFFQWKNEAMNSFTHWHEGAKAPAIMLALAAIVSLGVFEGTQFIYFQF